VLGVRFRPGGFRPWLGADVSTITDGVIPFSRWLGGDDVALSERVLTIEPLEARIAHVEELLRPVLPEPDPNVDVVHAVVTRIEKDASIRRVDDAARVAGLGLRDLQRLFRSYVGVSPKWVIQRARLQDAASRLANGSAVNLAELAQDLGYFDQAHLTRDFTRLVGRSPASYRNDEG
jgi:AraC-like DNA-binding protein